MFSRYKKWWLGGGALVLTVGGFILLSLAPAPRPVVPPPPKSAPRPELPARTNDFKPVLVEATDVGLTLTGQVVDAAGKPVPKATVSLAASQQLTLASAICTEDGEPLLSCKAPSAVAQVAGYLRKDSGLARAALTTTADGQGNFRFEKLQGSSFSVWATAEGRGAVIRERAAPGEPVQLVMPQQRTVRGVVESEDGRAVAGAKVTVFSRRLPLPAEATTTADGRFSVGGLGEGPFYVLGEAEGHLASAEPLVEAGAEPVKLKLLTPREIDVTVRSGGQPVAATVRVQGDHVSREVQAQSGTGKVTGLYPNAVTVVAHAGDRASAPTLVRLRQPVTNVTLDLEAAGSIRLNVVGDFGESVLDPTVWLGAAHGDFLLEKKARIGEGLVLGPLAQGDYVLRVSAPEYKSAEMPVAVKAVEVPLEVSLTRAMQLRGQVLDEYERPAPGVSVMVQPTGRTTFADGSGFFQLTVPSAGTYTLQAHHSDWGGGTMKVEAPAEQVRLMLEPRGTVDVLVEHNGRRVEGADAMLWHGEQDFFRSDRVSGSDGLVRMRGVPPGSYQVVASHPDYVESEKLRVDLKEGDTVRVKLEVGEGAKLSGQVVDEKGGAIAGAQVRLVPRAGRPVTTDAGGRFEVKPLKAKASYRVDVQHPSYDQVDRPTATAGGSPVKITVKARAVFRGRVVAERGGPVAHYRLDDQHVDAADGRFELPLPEVDGKVIFTVQARGFEPRAVELPASPDLGDISLVPSARVTGVVKDDAGQPVAQAVITCNSCDEAGSSGPDGRFTLAVPFADGSTELTARRWNMEGTVKLAEGQREAQITLKGATQLSGIVYDDEGRPTEGKEVAVLSTERGTAFMFVSGPKGAYRMELAQGVYRFMVGGFVPGGSIEMSGRQMLLREVKGKQMTLDLGPASGTSMLTVRLNPRPGHALWVVKGDVGPLANAQEALGNAADARLIYEPGTDRVVVPGLAPGRYTVVWGGYHLDVPGGPRVVKVELPLREELVLDAPQAAP